MSEESENKPSESDAERIQRLEGEVARQGSNLSCLTFVLVALALVVGGCCIFSMIPRERVRVKIGAPARPG